MKLLIVDMNALLSRAYYVRMKWYWYTMLLNRASYFAPTHITFCFDEPVPPEDNIRKAINPTYKANRKPDPDRYAFIEQIKKAVQEKFPFATYCHYEADDTIASIAYSFSSNNWEVAIMTGDKDLFQCGGLANTVILYLPDKETMVYNRQTITEKYMLPEEIATYKALAGDAGDNIKGGYKIGDKTARALIAEFGTIDNIFSNIHTIKPAVAKRLAMSEESIYQSLQLARLKFVKDTYIVSPFAEKDILALQNDYFNTLTPDEFSQIDWSLVNTTN